LCSNENPSSGKALSLFSDETNRASTAILNVATIFIHGTLAITLLGICLYKFPVATLIGLVLLAFCYLPLKIYEKRSSNKGIFLSEEWEKTNRVLTEGIRNNFYLKIIGMVDDEVRRAQRYLSNYLDKYKKAFMLIALRSSLPSLFGIFILVTIAFMHQNFQLFGQEFKFLEFFYIFLRYTQAISQTITSLGDFKINAESVHRLNDWLIRNPEKVPKIKTRGMLNSPIFSMNVDNISFSYENKRLLENINIKLVRGDVLTIKGKSGTGKSTLLQLLLGLIKPHQGNVTIAGYNIQMIRDEIIDEIAYVGPHAFMVEGTIKENLLYGNQRTIDDEEMREALELSILTEVISNLPHGLETELNEMGSSLSTGLKQRLMIARAILRKPQIIIFDEGTANLDDQTELQFVSKYRKLAGNLISIVVTHKNTFDSLATQNITLK
jgi:ABC-type multidrug transport system fused ATPase/permease subunit